MIIETPKSGYEIFDQMLKEQYEDETMRIIESINQQILDLKKLLKERSELQETKDKLKSQLRDTHNEDVGDY